MSCIHRRYRRSGHLWQNRFYSCPLGPDHAIEALAYVDLNPVRTGLARSAGKYPFSSAAAHLEGRDQDGLLEPWEFEEIAGSEGWKEALAARAAHA